MKLDSRLLSLFVPLVFGVTSPAGSAATTDEKSVVMDITQQACEAFRLSDLPTVEKLLAPTFTLVSSDSSVQDRKSVVAEIRNKDPQYEVFRNHSMTANVYGTAAVVQGITHVKGKSGGQSFDLEVRFTDTLIKTNGQWQLVVSHVTKIPTPPVKP